MHFPPTVKTVVFFARVGLGVPLVTYVYRGGYILHSCLE